MALERSKPIIVTVRTIQTSASADTYIHFKETAVQNSVPKMKFKEIDWSRRTYTRLNPQTGKSEIVELPPRSRD